MNKHLPHELKQMQSLLLEAKIIMTQQRIRQWYDHWDGMVYASIKKYNVPYCTVYGDIQVKPRSDAEEGQINLIDYFGEYEPEDVLETTGCNRTGCIFCMFGCHLEKEPNRFQRLKKTHPRQYEYCINGGEMVDGKWQPNKDGLCLGRVLDYQGIKY